MKRADSGILLCEEDVGALQAMLDRASRARDRDALDALASEMDRAKVVARAALPVDVICMGATVEFENEVTRRRQVVQLVYPAEADPAFGRVSVLAPVGAALLGLRPGQCLDWPVPRGSIRVRILRVTQPTALPPPLLRATPAIDAGRREESSRRDARAQGPVAD